MIIEKNVNGNLSKIQIILFVFGILLSPFYFGASGTLQIAHLLLLIVAIIEIFANRNLKLDYTKIQFVLLFFFVILSLLFHSLFYSSLILVSDLTYIFFNLILVVGLIEYFSKVNQKLICILFILSPLIVCCFTIFSTGPLNIEKLADMGRPKGPFNNPNQLGYYSVCAMSLLYLNFLNFFQIRKYFQFACYLIVFIISIYSLSKAAIIANLFFLFFWIFKNFKKIFFLFAIYIYYKIGNLENIIYAKNNVVLNRFSNAIDENDSSLEARGYMLPSDFFEFLFGIGESKINSILDHEVHSTFAHFFLTYGFIVGFIFLMLIFSWMKSLVGQLGVKSTFYVVLPAMAYSVSHNGSRFLFFWLLFSFSLGMSKRIKKFKENSSY